MREQRNLLVSNDADLEALRDFRIVCNLRLSTAEAAHLDCQYWILSIRHSLCLEAVVGFLELSSEKVQRKLQRCKAVS